MKIRHFVVVAALALFAVAQIAAQSESDAPLTREQILKQGPAALQANCTKCHLADKWEGTNRDRKRLGRHRQ